MPRSKARIRNRFFFLSFILVITNSAHTKKTYFGFGEQIMSTSLFIKYLQTNKLLEFPFCLGGGVGCLLT